MELCLCKILEAAGLGLEGAGRAWRVLVWSGGFWSGPGYLTVQDSPGTRGVLHSQVSWPGDPGNPVSLLFTTAVGC